jgi:hypothetical protein
LASYLPFDVTTHAFQFPFGFSVFPAGVDFLVPKVLALPFKMICREHFVIMIFYLLAIIMANYLRLSTSISAASETIPDKYLDLEHYKGLKNLSFDASRDVNVRALLKAAAGVYKNKTRGHKSGLQRTVLTTVLSYGTSRSFQYMVYFRNFLCFAAHYDFDLVVYVQHHDIPMDDLKLQLQSLEALGVRVLTYPDLIFWSLIAEKQSKVMIGNAFAPYVGDVPTFKSFGALVMLVPALEVLQHGYNVIYMDLDMGLVQDPIPYIMRGDADIVMSLEVRAPCPETYPSTNRGQKVDWYGYEPNSGVLLVRATPQGVAFYHRWLRRIVRTNVMNDQTVFDFKKEGGVTQFTANCNWDLSTARANTKRKQPDTGTFCFLPEMMFQNGLVGIQCSSKPAYRDDWYMNAVQQIPLYGQQADANTTTAKASVNSNNNNNSDTNSTSGTGRGVRLPVIIHANYCNDKSRQLDVRGLWLYDEKLTEGSNHKKMSNSSSRATTRTLKSAKISTSTSASSSTSTAASIPSAVWSESLDERARALSCKRYDVKDTYYYKGINWAGEVARISEYRTKWLREVQVNGTLIKPKIGNEVYLIDERLEKRVFPDVETFYAMGYSWESSHIKTVSVSIVNMIPTGAPIPSVVKSKGKNKESVASKERPATGKSAPAAKRPPSSTSQKTTRQHRKEAQGLGKKLKTTTD